jgi:hypothetical protein
MRRIAILGLVIGSLLGLMAYQASALVEESFGTLDGSVSSPAHYFHTNPKLGFYRNRDFDYIGFVASNREIFKYDLNGLTMVTGTLTVAAFHATGPVTFDSTLSVAGATTLAATSVTTLNASGTSTLAGVNAGATTVTTLNATGAVTLNTTLGVTGATTLTTLGTSGAVTLGSTLGVTGLSTLGATTVTTLGATGAATFSTTIGVTGLSTLLGGASIGTAAPTTITNVRVYSIATTPASVGAAVCVEQAVTVTGVTTADKIVLGGFTATGNATGYGAARVSASDTVQQTVCNPTAGALTPAASTNLYIAIRS